MKTRNIYQKQLTQSNIVYAVVSYSSTQIKDSLGEQKYFIWTINADNMGWVEGGVLIMQHQCMQ